MNQVVIRPLAGWTRELRTFKDPRGVAIGVSSLPARTPKWGLSQSLQSSVTRPAVQVILTEYSRHLSPALLQAGLFYNRHYCPNPLPSPAAPPVPPDSSSSASQATAQTDSASRAEII